MNFANFASEKMIRQKRREMAKDKANLGLTRCSLRLWKDALSSGHFSDADINIFENLILNSAKNDWGQHTQCTFDRVAMTCVVENFDGRKMTL